MVGSNGEIHLIDIVGYDFYYFSFIVAVCLLPLVFWRYSLVLLAVVAIVIIAWKLWRHVMVGTIDVKGRGVLITGCDTGLGYSFACHLDEIGFTVFAGCLDEKGQGARTLRTKCSNRLHVVPLDVTKDASIAKTVQYVKTHRPKNGLWGVVNNAGMNMIGDVEISTVAIYEKGFNLNLYGAIRVCKAFLPQIRKSKGRIVNISSVHGCIAMARASNYEVAKHGLETVSDSLRLEMKKFGVHVAIVAPSMFGHATSGLSAAALKRMTEDIEEMRSMAAPEIQHIYNKRYCESWLIPEPFTKGWNSMTDVLQPVFTTVAHALCSQHPLPRYLVDGKGSHASFIDEYATLGRMTSVLPTRIIDAYTAYWTGSDRLIH